MRFSNLNWRLKLLALTLFAGSMAGVAMLAHWLVYDVLPVWLVSFLGAVAIGYGLGFFTGEYFAKQDSRSLIENRADRSPPRAKQQ